MKKTILIFCLALAIFAGCDNKTEDNTNSEDTTTHVIMPEEEVLIEENKEIADPLNGWYEVVNDEYNFTALFPKYPETNRNSAESLNPNFENMLQYVYNDEDNNAYIITIFHDAINTDENEVLETSYISEIDKDMVALESAEKTSFWGFPGANVQAITDLGFGITKKLIFVDNNYLVEIMYFDKSDGANHENADIFLNGFNLSLK